jgi:hypothetical protein
MSSVWRQKEMYVGGDWRIWQVFDSSRSSASPFLIDTSSSRDFRIDTVDVWGAQYDGCQRCELVQIKRATYS